jgi:hypothetical protein
MASYASQAAPMSRSRKTPHVSRTRPAERRTRPTGQELAQPPVPDFPRHETLRDDPLRLPTRLQHGVCEHPHQTNVAAAVHQFDVGPCQFRSKFLGGGSVFGAATGTGAAEDADSFHAAIVCVDSPRSGGEDMPLSGTVKKRFRNGKTAGSEDRVGGEKHKGRNTSWGHLGWGSWVAVAVPFAGSLSWLRGVR